MNETREMPVLTCALWYYSPLRHMRIPDKTSCQASNRSGVFVFRQQPPLFSFRFVRTAPIYTPCRLCRVGKARRNPGNVVLGDAEGILYVL